MKKNALVIPLMLAGLVLLLILITAITNHGFKRSVSEIIEHSIENNQIVGPDFIHSIKPEQIVIIKIGAGNLPSSLTGIELKEIALSQLLDKEYTSMFKDKNRKKIIFSKEITDAAKAWTFLMRMGYNNLFIFDADKKSPVRRNDSILQGNESFQYTFKPERE